MISRLRRLIIIRPCRAVPGGGSPAPLGPPTAGGVVSGGFYWYKSSEAALSLVEAALITPAAMIGLEVDLSIISKAF